MQFLQSAKFAKNVSPRNSFANNCVLCLLACSQELFVFQVFCFMSMWLLIVGQSTCAHLLLIHNYLPAQPVQKPLAQQIALKCKPLQCYAHLVLPLLQMVMREYYRNWQSTVISTEMAVFGLRHTHVQNIVFTTL